jgi:adenine-specific DNA-methyltransferase
MSVSSAAEPTFTLANRKFLGAKTALLDWLFEEFARRASGALGVFCDPMAGTGVVAYEAARRGGTERVVAGDFLLSNVVPLRAFLLPAQDGQVAETIGRLNRLEPRPGYVAWHFGGSYFSQENAARIDAIRQAVEDLADPALADAALASLLYAADKAANTVGQFDAYMKNLDGPSVRHGRHLVDASAHKPLLLRTPACEPVAPAEVHLADAIELVARTPCDVLYLDPPYNSRQYVDLYHVLENIARWEKPRLSGVTRKFPRAHLRSRFSSRRHAGEELARLVDTARCRHLFLSYSSEGLLSHEELTAILGRAGRPEVSERQYPVFGRGAGRSRRRNVSERLYYVRRG